MPEAEFWARLNHQLGIDYAPSWANTISITDLDGRTVQQALADGLSCKEIWRAVWAVLELPQSEL